MVRAPVRVGWDRARSRELHHHFLRDHVAAVPFQHQVQGFLEFARILGIPVEDPLWNLPIEEEATAWAETGRRRVKRGRHQPLLERAFA